MKWSVASRSAPLQRLPVSSLVRVKSSANASATCLHGRSRNRCGIWLRTTCFLGSSRDRADSGAPDWRNRLPLGLLLLSRAAPLRDAATDGRPADRARAVALGQPSRRALHVEDVPASQPDNARVGIDVVQTDAADLRLSVLAAVAGLHERKLDNPHQLPVRGQPLLLRRPCRRHDVQCAGGLELLPHERGFLVAVDRQYADARLEGQVGRRRPDLVPVAGEARTHSADDEAVRIQVDVHAQVPPPQAPREVRGDLRHLGRRGRAHEDNVQTVRSLRELQLRENVRLSLVAVDRGDLIPGRHHLVGVLRVPRLYQAGLDLQHRQASDLDLHSDSDWPCAIAVHLHSDLCCLRCGIVHHLCHWRCAADIPHLASDPRGANKRIARGR
mmetsp:Transcript_53606/g.141281  ORF Transcript_53606/g.141281 Transcript_53606/m.141281 type:complete len:386 (+) Transcript_53606:89-1246(+)